MNFSFSGTLPHKHKIVIAGNHELSFDPRFTSIQEDNTIPQKSNQSGIRYIIFNT